MQPEQPIDDEGLNIAEDSARSSSSVCKQLSLSTVTALAVTSTLVLLGEGPIFRIYDRVQLSCLSSRQLFTSQAIHGFAVQHVSADRILVIAWGGRILCAILLHFIQEQKNSPSKLVILDTRRHVCSDWILHCAFKISHAIRVTSHFEAAAVTAHNALLSVQIRRDNIVNSVPCVTITVHHLTPASRCMLYAARLHWLNSQHIVIAAGSALGDVVVWTFIFDSTSEGVQINHSETHHIFTAHDGSVFGLDIIKLNAGPTNDISSIILVTCSDDRTIRVWDVSAALPSIKPPSTSFRVKPDRQTRVLHPADLLDSSRKTGAPHITRAWGHLSRIWHITFLEQATSHGADSHALELISVGEDATLQLWSLQLVRNKASDSWTGILGHISTHQHHSGKNIWSFSNSAPKPEGIECVTGGADGSVSVFMVARGNDTSQARSQFVKEWEMSEVLLATSQRADTASVIKLDVKSRDFFRDYDFVGDDAILATTNRGHVFLGTCLPMRLLKGGNATEEHRSTNHKWFWLCQIDSLSSYSIVAGVPAAKAGFVADAIGSIYCFENTLLNQTPIIQMGGKVASLFVQVVEGLGTYETFNVLLDNERSTRKCIVLLVTRLGSNVASLFFMNGSSEFICGSAGPIIEAVEILLHPGFVPTAMLCVKVEEANYVLFIGDRSGQVTTHVLHFTADGHVTTLQDHPQSCGATTFTFHRDAVTSFTWKALPSTSTDGSTSGYLLTTGRDSSYAIHQISSNIKSHSPLLVHQAILPFGPNIEGFYMLPKSSHLMFYGFKGKHFVVFDETSQIEFVKIECGGAHRLWAFLPQLDGAGPSAGKLAWTRTSKLNISDMTGDERRTLKSGGHGREIKACAVSPLLHAVDRSSMRIIATGAEDTDIRLFFYSSGFDKTDSSQLECVSTLRKHATGVQQLQWSADGRYLFSSGGSEEFFVWRTQSTPFTRISIVCEATLPPASTLPDLRITSFDAVHLSNSQAAPGSLHAESSFFICMVFSDSTIRRYLYTGFPRMPSWTLLQTGNHSTCCLTQIQHLHTNSVGKEGILTTAGTDGTLAIWGFSNLPQQDTAGPEVLRLLKTAKIHQSSIKCLTIVFMPAQIKGHTTHLVVSGGDDNALALTRLEICSIESDSEGEKSNEPLHASLEVSTLLLPRAHAAAITAVVAISMASVQYDADRGRSQQNGVDTSTTLKVVTASNDQRLKLWEVGIDLAQQGVSGITVKKAGNVSTPVADVGSMVMMPDIDPLRTERTGRELVVCGVGMDVWGVD